MMHQLSLKVFTTSYPQLNKDRVKLYNSQNMRNESTNIPLVSYEQAEKKTIMATTSYLRKVIHLLYFN
jgi:hypothetical protein